MDNTTPSSTHAMAVAATETVVGSHVLTIDGYTKTTAALAVGESIQSDLFRVGGHGWYVECYPCGQYEEGADWVSVFLCLDHHQGGSSHEAVKASHKFVLLDRAGDAVLSARSRHVKTFSSDDGSWGAGSSNGSRWSLTCSSRTTTAAVSGVTSPSSSGSLPRFRTCTGAISATSCWLASSEGT